MKSTVGRFMTGAFFVLSSTITYAAPVQYFCSVDKTTGFFFENKKWDVANFGDQSKYILKEVVAISNGPTWVTGEAVWELTEVGDSYSIAVCGDWTTNMNGQRERLDLIECHGIFKARFNKSNLRFLIAYMAGYTDGADDNKNTPYLALGKCSPL